MAEEVCRSKLVQCRRRFPTSSEKRCVVQFEQHNRCLSEAKEWRPADSLRPKKLLEM